MFFLNLTSAEFFTILGALSAFIAALYLLDRTKRKNVVSTLRFWTPALTADHHQSRRRMREPWSLVLQLISLLLLLLAVAQLQWGTRDRRGRDHVLLLDISSWAGERNQKGTLLDREKSAAGQYLTAIPARDRVMLVRVDALATPVSGFTSDRGQLLKALAASQAGFSALNIEQAISFARQAQSWSGSQHGEIVYIGPKLVLGPDTPAINLPNLRTIGIPATRENCGILRIGVRRGDEKASPWKATVVLKNYSSEPRTVRLKTRFAGTAFAPRALALEPGEERAAEYIFVTDAAGQFAAEISPADALSSDDRAALDLPGTGMLKIAVYTSRPEVLRPLLEANHHLRVVFYGPSEYEPKPDADVMLLDQTAAGQPPKIASLWLDPPTEGSPLALKTTIGDTVIRNWNSETALGAGLHAKETRVPSAEVFQSFEGDVPVASVAEGPIIVARVSNQTHAKLAVIGFDPLSGQLRFQVTTPLLFANLLRWLAPESFRTLDLTAGHVGDATVTLDPGELPDRIRIRDEKGSALPFTIRNHVVQLFTSSPSIVHITSDDRERVLSLTLPEVGAFEWKPKAQTRVGLPSTSSFTPGAVDLWKLLSLLGGLGLFIEWMLFGRRRLSKWRKRNPEVRQRAAHEREMEFVAK